MLNIPLDRIIPVTYARDNLANIIKGTNGDTIYVLTKGGRPKVALVDIVYLEKLIGHKLTTSSFSPSQNNQETAEKSIPKEPEESVPAKIAVEPTSKPQEPEFKKSEPIKPSEPAAFEKENIIEPKKEEVTKPIISIDPKPASSVQSSIVTPETTNETKIDEEPNNSADDTNATITADEKKIEPEKEPELSGTDQIPYMNFTPQEEESAPTPQIPSADEIISQTNKDKNPVSTFPSNNPVVLPNEPAPAEPIQTPPVSPSAAQSVPSSPTTPATNIQTPSSSVLNNLTATGSNAPKTEPAKKPEGTIIPIKNQSQKNQSNSTNEVKIAAAPTTDHASVDDLDIG